MADSEASAPQRQDQQKPYLDSFPEWEAPRNPKPSLLSRLRISTAPKRRPKPTPTVGIQDDPQAPVPDTHPPIPTPPVSRLDRVLPPHKRYLNNTFSRRSLLRLLILLLCLILLALLFALPISLTGHHHHFLPLPSTGGIYTGDLTYYAPGLGACGVTSASSEMIVAIAWDVFDAAGGGDKNPNQNSLCGRKIRLERDYGSGKGNRSVDVTVVDRCTGCKSLDLDLSPDAFDILAERDLGRVTGSWAWL